MVANLSPALADELDLDGVWRGVVVLEVPRNSAARRFGFRRGDVLHEVNGQVVQTVSQFGVAVEAAEGGWQMRVEREGRIRSVDFSG